MLSKLAAQESHGAPPGLYLLLFWVTFWPGAPLAGMAAPAVWRARREPGAQYLLAWLIPSWIVFELVLTKLPHYVLPLYPAIAILTVGALERRVLSRSWLIRGAAWWFAIPAVAAVIAIVGAIKLTHQPVFPAWPLLAAAMIFGLIAWWLFEDSRAERSLLNAVIAAMFLADRRLRHRDAVADDAVSKRRGRARAAQRRLCRAKGRRCRLPRAEPRVHDGYRHAVDRRIGRRGFSGAGQLPLRAGGSSDRSVFLSSAPKRSGCATTWPRVSRAITSRRAGRFRSRSSAPKAPSKMAAPTAIAESRNYASRFVALAWLSLTQLVRAPSHSRRAEAARRAARHVLWLSAVIGVAIIALMYALDAWEIGQMPKRGSPGLWWMRILTDFGKDEYVLGALAVLLIAVAIISPAMRGIQRSLLLGLGTRLQFLFCAVAVPVLIGEVDQMVGRPRPAVCRRRGQRVQLLAFQRERAAYSSFPSGHAITAFALAFAVAALWPKARPAMIVYALVILATRLVLLAHHPSDVVAGALVGVDRRDVRALLVCGPAARICDPPRRHHRAAGRTLVGAPQKGCPGRIRPIRSGPSHFEVRSTDECRFAFFRPSCGGRFHRCARAQRGGQRRAVDCGDHGRARRPLGLRNHLCQ